MTINLGQLIVWLLIGALAGTLASRVVKGRRRSYSLLGNMVIGLIGALIGGILFRLLNINLGLGVFTLSVEDLIAAFVGAVLLLLLLRSIR